jgi:hypothetical protein
MKGPLIRSAPGLHAHFKTALDPQNHTIPDHRSHRRNRSRRGDRSGRVSFSWCRYFRPPLLPFPVSLGLSGASRSVGFLWLRPDKPHPRRRWRDLASSAGDGDWGSPSNRAGHGVLDRLTPAILKEFGVEHEAWVASKASVQTLAERVSGRVQPSAELTETCGLAVRYAYTGAAKNPCFRSRTTWHMAG